MTAADQRLVLRYLPEAEVAASGMYRLKMSREELLGSAYYGLCRAALIRPRPEPFGRYASRCCYTQIVKDYRRLYLPMVGSRPVVFGDLDWVPAPPATEPDLDDEAGRLNAAIDRLPLLVDRVIVRAALTGLHPAAIGRRIGWARETTARHLAAAVRALRAELAGSK